MMTLIGIQREYVGQDILPLRVQGLANAAMIGVIYCNGFGGRCGEWCILKLRDFRAQMKRGKSYVLCQEHKTSHVYGDLAKWLAEGSKEAMTTYAGLPRRDDCETFFHPSFEGVRTVDVHHALKRFGEKFLPECQQKPTVNLMRKWYHTKLMTMSKTEDELYALMSRIDAHSQSVAAKHYVLQNPEHDANLAKILVEEVLGTTVPWPKDGAPALAEVEGEDQGHAVHYKRHRRTRSPRRSLRRRGASVVRLCARVGFTRPSGAATRCTDRTGGHG